MWDCTRRRGGVSALWPLLTLLAKVIAVRGAAYPPDMATDSPMDTSTGLPLSPMKIESIDVDSQIVLTYARTLVVTSMRNTDFRRQEAVFSLILPETAFVTQFTMFVNGKPYTGFVREKDFARSMYAAATHVGLGAAHVAASVRDSNHFTVSVNVEPFANAVFYLTYEELLARKDGCYTHTINLYPGQLVHNLNVNVYVREGRKIRYLQVPEMSTGASLNTNNIANHFAAVNWRSGDLEASVRFRPTMNDQVQLMNIYQKKLKEAATISNSNSANSRGGMLGQFIVKYDVDRTLDGELFVNDGYFVHFFNPPGLRLLNKHIVFVLDTSGSMDWNNKMGQLRQAMIKILSDLRTQDYFAIIEFNTDAQVIVQTSQATPTNINRAKQRVRGLVADGGTNILQAMQQGLSEVRKRPAGTHEVPIIFFLTDGDPTVGETDTATITNTIDQTNSDQRKATIYTLAFGDDAKHDFLKNIAVRNRGVLKHIYQAGDAEQQLEKFYQSISSPVMTDVKFRYLPEQVNPQYATNTIFHTVGNGSQAIVSGKVVGQNLTREKIDFVGVFDTEQKKKLIERVAATPPVYIKESFGPLERVWAYLNIKQLLEKYHVYRDHTAKEDALGLALKYQFVTELTSMVVVKPHELTNVVDTPPALLIEPDQPSTSAPETEASNTDNLHNQEVERLNQIIEQQSQAIKKMRDASNQQYQKYEQEKSMMRAQIKDLTSKMDRLESTLQNFMSSSGSSYSGHHN